MTANGSIPFAHIGSSTRIPSRSRFVNPDRIWLGDYIFMEENIAFDTGHLVFNEEPDRIRIKIGDCTTIGRHCLISAINRIEIGRHVLLAQNVYLADNGHHYEDVGVPIRYQYHSGYRGGITIEDGCWLGRNVVIVGSRRPLTIGTGSVIGANAVVTFSVPSYAVVTGNPARITRLYDPEADDFVRVRSPEEIERVLANRERLGIQARPVRVDLARFHHFVPPIEIEDASPVAIGALVESAEAPGWKAWLAAFLEAFGPDDAVSLVLGVCQDGPWEQTVQAISAHYDALTGTAPAPSVIVHPFVEGERPRWLRALKACAIDSEHELGELRCLEAMACGVPILGSATDRVGHWLRDGHTGFAGGDRTVLLQRCHRDPETLATLGGHARVKLEDAFGVPHVNVHEPFFYYTPSSDHLGL